MWYTAIKDAPFQATHLALMKIYCFMSLYGMTHPITRITTPTPKNRTWPPRPSKPKKRENTPKSTKTPKNPKKGFGTL